MDSKNYLWIDKYQPRSLKDLTYNEATTQILENLSKKDDFPHLIFCGVEGAGKKTRIHAFLSEIFGPGIYKVNTEMRSIKNNSTIINYTVTSSNYHIELCPSESEYQDRFIIQTVIKETSSTLTVNSQQKKFKVIVLYEVDNLTKDAQAALRRTMEKYSKNCRIIMSCNSLSKIIPPIRSRCLSIRVAVPSNEQIKNVLNDIVKKEECNINDNQINYIVQNAQNNLREAISYLQLTTLDNYGPNKVFIPEYSVEIDNVINLIIKDQSANSLKEIRKLLLNLIVNGINKEEIILEIVKRMINRINNDTKKKSIVEYGVIFDNRIMNGNKAIFHLEAFVARIMLILNQP